jgi:MFS transporter, PAT family, beta-lactamase induction signal transducer AmpG
VIKRKNLRNVIWVFTTYFAQGLPYSLIAVIPSIMFRDIGADLSTIGFLSVLSLPWVLKFLWAPFVDSRSTLRHWLFFAELAISLAMALLSVSLFSDTYFPIIFFLAFGALFSATHDIAIDGFYMDALDEDSQKKQIGFRVFAYRIALAFGAGVIITIGTAMSWKCAYGVASFIMFVLYVFHRFFLPPAKQSNRSDNKYFSVFKLAFFSYFKRDKIGYIVVFIVFLRAGEYMLGLMRGPFLVDLGIKIHIGWMSGAVAIPASIAGAIFGGFLISKAGVLKTAIPIILFQNFTNLLYALLAFVYSEITDITGILVVASTNAIESFSSGMGTALLMIFLMKLCKSQFKAAHYAIGSGLMAISGVMLNSVGGLIAEITGYGWFFVISFFIAMPAIFCVKEIDFSFNMIENLKQNKD